MALLTKLKCAVGLHNWEQIYTEPFASPRGWTLEQYYFWKQRYKEAQNIHRCKECSKWTDRDE